MKKRLEVVCVTSQEVTREKQNNTQVPKMQTTLALTLHTILAEEQFSLDELVIVLRKVIQEEGMPGLLKLILEVADELWAIRACREGKLPGPSCCDKAKWEIKDRVQRRLRTSGGEVRFNWRRLVCKNCRKQLVPMRQWLRLERWQSKSSELERIVVETVTEQSYRRSSNHLDTIGVIPVPKSTAHRWVAQTSCDELDWPQAKLPGLMVDSTGFKRRPDRENAYSNQGEIRVVIGLDAKGAALPIGSWSDKSWEDIATELEAKAKGQKLAEQLSCDGEPGLADRLARLVNSVQRCHWHMVHDLDRFMWRDKAPLGERRKQQKHLAGIIGIQLPKDDFQAIKPQDKQELDLRVQTADQDLSELVRTLHQKGYHEAAKYVSYAQGRLFKYVQFWMQTGVIAPRTTSYLERLMREIGRRLKRIAFGWSETGAAKMARIILRRICNHQQWADYWKNKLGLTGTVIIQFLGAKTVAP